mmetsp:Transcript_40153/g.115389  ORF Transcript_40153/g.115389 Transcript_40153/m.115389 type:complete len:327 (-) Transcript_40153:1781-2761(-)
MSGDIVHGLVGEVVGVHTSRRHPPRYSALSPAGGSAGGALPADRPLRGADRRPHLFVHRGMAPPCDSPRLHARYGSDPRHDSLHPIDRQGLRERMELARHQPLATLSGGLVLGLERPGQLASGVRPHPIPRSDLDQDATVGVVQLVLDAMLHSLQIPIALVRQHEASASYLVQKNAQLPDRHVRRAATPCRHRAAATCVLADHQGHHLPGGHGHREHNVGALREGDLEIRRPPAIRRPCLVHPGVERGAVHAGDVRHDAVSSNRHDETVNVDEQKLALACSAGVANMHPFRPESTFAEPSPSADRGRGRFVHWGEHRVLAVRHDAA